MKREKLLYIVILVVSLLIIGLVIAGFIAQRIAKNREEARRKAATTPAPGGNPKEDSKTGNDPSIPAGINANYVQEMAWKFNDYVTKGRLDYACEVSNGIVTMGLNDLKALAETYEKWYGQKLANDYCTKLNGSGCVTSIFDGVHTKACNRLKSL